MELYEVAITWLRSIVGVFRTIWGPSGRARNAKEMETMCWDSISDAEGGIRWRQECIV